MISPVKEHNFKLRVLFVGLVFGLMYCVVVARAVDLMVVQGPKLSEKARKQHNRVMRLTPRRGPIVDRNGLVLAESVPVDSVYAHPRQVTDPAAAAKILAVTLGEKEERMLEKLASSGRFTWIKRAITPEQADAIKRSDLDGVVVIGEYARYYPQGSLAAQALGFVGAYGKGLEGLERRFNDILAGNEERFVIKRDARGKPLYRDPESMPDPKGGDKLVLTIDARIQAIVEEALEDAVTSSEAENGIAAVMEVRTGKVLAIAARPTFDPNNFRNYPAENYRNRVVTDPFEPGSTFKIFTLAALLDSGEGAIYDELFCEDGAYEVDGRIINDTHPHGWFTIEEIIVHSSNIGASKIGLKLGRDTMNHYVKNFGFGSVSGIDLPGESKGIMRPFRKLSRVGLANVAFGQGIGATGIQMLAAINAMATGGKLLTPLIVDRIVDSDGNLIRAFKTKTVRTVISEQTARQATHVLVNVVHGGGTGKRAAPTGYIVAGKTGTAQKVNFESGGYYNDKYLASFTGWAPAENPEISVIVVINDPKGEPWGGSVAAPAFKEIAERSLPILGIMPDENVIADNIAAGDLPNRNIPVATDDYYWDDKPENTTVENPCNDCMPDLLGLPLRKVLSTANKYGVAVKVIGSGRVFNQIPQPGVPLEGVQKWHIELTTGPN